MVVTSAYLLCFTVPSVPTTLTKNDLLFVGHGIKELSKQPYSALLLQIHSKIMVLPIPQVLVAGLGNLPMPSTRHRYILLHVCAAFFNIYNFSLGQYLVDALALRLGIRMSSDRKGVIGQGIVTLGDTPVSLILYKSSKLSVIRIFRLSSICHLRRIFHERVRTINS